MALVVSVAILLFYIKLSEEVEGHHRVDVHNYTHEHHCQHKLLMIQIIDQTHYGITTSLSIHHNILMIIPPNRNYYYYYC